MQPPPWKRWTYNLHVHHTHRMPAGQGRSRAAQRPASAAVADRAESTRNALVAAARRLFVERGYHATSTEQIVALAGVGTRGALYHHFADKRALFVAVFEAVEQDLVAAAGAAIQEAPPLEMLRNGLIGFLDASLTPEVQRILLIDGPAVLGWQEWRAIEARYGLGGIRGMLELAVADGSLPRQPLEVLAHLLLATTDEAALFIANANDPAAARDQAVGALDRLLSGIKGL
jgi:AcrR family transcriptional regulator